MDLEKPARRACRGGLFRARCQPDRFFEYRTAFIRDSRPFIGFGCSISPCCTQHDDHEAARQQQDQRFVGPALKTGRCVAHDRADRAQAERAQRGHAAYRLGSSLVRSDAPPPSRPPIARKHGALSPSVDLRMGLNPPAANTLGNSYICQPKTPTQYFISHFFVYRRFTTNVRNSHKDTERHSFRWEHGSGPGL